MLSLNSLTEKTASLRPQEPKARTHAPEERENRPDFQSYLFAATQQPKPEPMAQPAAPKAEAAAMERPVAEGVTTQNTTTTTETAAQNTAQKAGHEAAGQQTTNAASEEKAASETAETKGRQTPIARNEKELLEVLGLSAHKLKAAEKKPRDENTRAVSGLKETAATQKNEGKGFIFKAETATHTLTLLEKSPDLILMSSDGLKRLGEKLGLSLLGKVNDKLTEKSQRADSTQAQLTGKADPLQSALQGRTQKTGADDRQSDSQAQNQQKSFRQTAARSVSRETLATETPVPLRQALGDSSVVVSPSNHDALSRNQNPAIQAADIHLSEAAASARTTDNVRVAVENPLMRADLVRQFNEIMSRAQVLVTDTQNAQFSVKLFPREIGRMEIDLKMVDGEIRGKIVVESEDVKNEMQNFLQNRDNQPSGEQFDMNRIDIEVRNGYQNAQNPQQAPETAELLQNLVTQSASAAYNAVETTVTQGNALYA